MLATIIMPGYALGKIQTSGCGGKNELRAVEK